MSQAGMVFCLAVAQALRLHLRRNFL